MKRIIKQFILASNTFKVSLTLPNPIRLDNPTKKYTLKLVMFQFSNVVPNVKEDQYVDGTKIADRGCYEIDELYSLYNQNGNYGQLTLSINTGKCTLLNNTGNTLTINSSNLLTSKICGNFTLPITLNDGESITSPSTCSVSTFNYFLLSSPNISGFTYTSINSGQLLPSNTLYPVSSAIKPLGFKNWVSVQPVEFFIDSNILNYIEFEIKTSDGQSITDQLMESDFMITVQIVEYPK